MRGSTDKWVQTAAGDKARSLHSHLHLVLISDKGKTSERGPRNPRMLSSTIGEAGEGESPHRQSALSDATSEASVEEGEIIHPIAS